MSEFYLAIEPYVYIFVTGNEALLFNTLDSNSFLTDDLGVVRIVEILNSGDGLYVAKLSNEELESDTCKAFISFLRHNYMGDILPFELCKKKPVQLRPLLNIQTDINLNRNENKELEIPSILQYLTNISLILNESSNSQFSKITKQANFNPANKSLPVNEIDFTLVKNTLNRLKETLYYINLNGIEIFKYSKLFELISLLENYDAIKELHCNLKNLALNISKLENRALTNFHFSISISLNEFDRDEFLRTFSFLQTKKIVHDFKFLIENMEQYGKTEKLIAIYNIESYSILPFYNGGNLAFFKEMVFIDKDDILNDKKEMNQILANEAINSYFFGKIHIVPSGDVYISLNEAKIGNLFRIDISEIVYNEMNNEGIWFLTRTKISPCKNCIYCSLCPPISNYELSIGQFNLCSIINN
ncbi:MAG: TIGR04150 pseudo-rSAM protein [Bacteroidales bacterium]|nr:TIGR04150 pseudo-rSAM protein [Bacteroidales bacterium]